MYYVKSQNCNGSPGTAYTRRGLENMGEHLSADWHGLTIDGAIEWLKVKGTGSNQTWRRESALEVLAVDTARAAWIAGASAAEAHLIYREIANPAKDIFMVEYSALTDRLGS